MKTIFLSLLGLAFLSASGQLVIDNATFFIGENAVVTVQGNVTSNVAIQAGGAGTTQGKLQLKGSSLQQINTNGNVIPRLEIDNTSHASLVGDVRVSQRLEFTNGKIQLGNFNFIIDDGITVVTPGASKFLETNGTGQARRLVGANVADRDIPVGNGTNYTPFRYTTATSTYAAGAYVAVRSTGAAIPTPQRHPRTESFLGTAWKVTKSGITGGSLVGRGTYLDPQVTGTEADLRGMYWNGTTWSMAGGAQDGAGNTVTANVTANSGDLYGMNRFLLANVKVFLQGAYNAGTGLMNDNLRISPSVIPTSDPYRGAPYNATFTHVANATAETVAASLFNNNVNPNDDVVDWVYVELRNNTTPGNTVLQTRSVMVQRDGDLVDVDGVSPVYFKNLDATNYTIAIRHRNHLGLSTNPATPIALNMSGGTVNLTNLATGSLFGTANTNYQRTAGNVNMLYAGNSNFNANVRFSGPANDKDHILAVGLSSNALTVLNPVYSFADLNMNRIVRFSGPANDKDFLLSAPLSSTPLAVRQQTLPQ